MGGDDAALGVPTSTSTVTTVAATTVDAATTLSGVTIDAKYATTSRAGAADSKLNNQNANATTELPGILAAEAAAENGGMVGTAKVGTANTASTNSMIGNSTTAGPEDRTPAATAAVFIAVAVVVAVLAAILLKLSWDKRHPAMVRWLWIHLNDRSNLGLDQCTRTRSNIS